MDSPPKGPNEFDFAYAPTGALITGSLETVSGNALIDRFTVKDGRIEDIEYQGETKMFWDGQHTVKIGGRRQFLDEDGQQWSENRLAFSNLLPHEYEALLLKQYPPADWQYEVANGDTRKGFIEWREAKQEQARHEAQPKETASV